jgi:hypothetical protein
MGEERQLTRLEYDTLEREFVAEQINAYIAEGVSVFVPMPEMRLARLVAGATESGEVVRVQFAGDNLPRKRFAAARRSTFSSYAHD